VATRSLWIEQEDGLVDDCIYEHLVPRIRDGHRDVVSFVTGFRYPHASRVRGDWLLIHHCDVASRPMRGHHQRRLIGLIVVRHVLYDPIVGEPSREIAEKCCTGGVAHFVLQRTADEILGRMANESCGTAAHRREPPGPVNGEIVLIDRVEDHDQCG
jgi:hypothetical protein